MTDLTPILHCWLRAIRATASFGSGRRIIYTDPFYFLFNQYRALLEAGLSSETIDRLRRATRFCVPYGDNNFRADVERRLGFSVGYARSGRPRRSDRDEE